MSHARRFFAALLFFLGGTFACATVHPPSPPALPTQIVFANEVVQNMFEIQGEYANETARCLTGYVHRGVIYIASSEPTWINTSSPVHVNFHQCAAPNTVAWYHNHPSGRDANGLEVNYCQFSAQDVETLNAYRVFLVAVMTCGANTLVWQYKGTPEIHYWQGVVPEMAGTAPPPDSGASR